MITLDVKEYINPANNTVWYSATYGNSTYHNRNKEEVEQWLKDHIVNAEYYEARAKAEHEAMELWYNSK